MKIKEGGRNTMWKGMEVEIHLACSGSSLKVRTEAMSWRVKGVVKSERYQDQSA